LRDAEWEFRNMTISLMEMQAGILKEDRASVAKLNAPDEMVEQDTGHASLAVSNSACMFVH
jgi:hypothetical protein